jgi:glycerol kinase
MINDNIGKTGLPLNPYFSGSKLFYLLSTVVGLRKDAEDGDALFGTIDTWLVWNLTQGQVFSTDVSNASRTLLMNIHTLEWDEELLSIFKVPRCMLPTINPSSHIVGVISGMACINGVSIGGVLGDQQAALFGQVCFTSSEAKCTYGTCASIMMNTGTDIIPSSNGLLTSVAFQLGRGGRPQYCLEGSVAYCGSLVQWLRDNLGLISSTGDSETLAGSVDDNGGVFFVPAFAGLFAPYWLVMTLIVGF